MILWFLACFILHCSSSFRLHLLQFLMDPNFSVSSCDECFQFGARVSTILPASPGCLTKFIKLADIQMQPQILAMSCDLWWILHWYDRNYIGVPTSKFKVKVLEVRLPNNSLNPIADIMKGTLLDCLICYFY